MLKCNKIHTLYYLTALFIFILIIIHACLNKPFWNDERYDIQMIAHTDFSILLLGKTIHPNNNPLYYVLQKANLSLWDFDNSYRLITHRLISIVSAVLVLLILMKFMQASFGILWAVWISLTVINNNFFVSFAAESRHYMLWVLCFTVLLFSAVRLCRRPFAESSLSDKLIFAGACLSITLVISMGFIQVFFAVISCLAVFHSTSDVSDKKKLWAYGVAVFFLCFLTALFYSTQKLTAFGQFYGSTWDLNVSIEKGDYSLLKAPLRVLWPKPGRDAYLGAAFNNFFTLAALVLPAYYWPRRRSLNPEETTAFAVSLVIIFQLLAAVAYGCVIVYFHFYFIQRLFLPLAVCHALLSAVGAFAFFYLLPADMSRKYFNLKRFPFYMKYASMALLMIFIIFACRWHTSFNAENTGLQDTKTSSF